MMLRRVWTNVGLGKFFLLFGVSILFGLGERMGTQGSLPLHLLILFALCVTGQVTAGFVAVVLLAALSLALILWLYSRGVKRLFNR